jgi:hypothetical protein
MTNKDEAAFPREWSKIKQNKDAPEQFSVAQKGLTKREYFAALAMQGLMTDASLTSQTIAKFAVQQADDLLNELNKQC